MRCAELLNKWAASSPEYSVQMVEQSAFFAFEAADIYAAALQEQGPQVMTLDDASPTTNTHKSTESVHVWQCRCRARMGPFTLCPQSRRLDLVFLTRRNSPTLQALTNTIYDYATALYWMSLNFATLCRLGGGATWNAEQAKRIAEEALGKCMKERREQGVPEAKMADTLFAQSVLNFCFAEAYAKGIISKASNGDESSVSDSESSDALYKKSYAMLKDVNEKYRKALGGKHLESVKCLTMLSVIARKTGMIKDAIEWCKLELAMRQEV